MGRRSKILRVALMGVLFPAVVMAARMLTFACASGTSPTTQNSSAGIPTTPPPGGPGGIVTPGSTR